MDFDLNCTPTEEEDVPGGSHDDRNCDFNMKEDPIQDAGCEYSKNMHSNRDHELVHCDILIQLQSYEHAFK